LEQKSPIRIHAIAAPIGHARHWRAIKKVSFSKYITTAFVKFLTSSQMLVAQFQTASPIPLKK